MLRKKCRLRKRWRILLPVYAVVKDLRHFFFHSFSVSVVEPKCVINPSDCHTLFSEISFGPEKASLEKLRHKAVLRNAYALRAYTHAWAKASFTFLF